MRRLFLLGCASAALIVSTAAAASETITYTYDARGRLKQVAHSGTPSINNGVATSYTYDKADNRTNKTTTGSSNPPPP
jgi:YD repeat-containing protein